MSKNRKLSIIGGFIIVLIGIIEIVVSLGRNDVFNILIGIAYIIIGWLYFKAPK